MNRFENETAGQFLQRLGVNGELWANEMSAVFGNAAIEFLPWCANMIEAGKTAGRSQTLAQHAEARTGGDVGEAITHLQSQKDVDYEAGFDDPEKTKAAVETLITAAQRNTGGVEPLPDKWPVDSNAMGVNEWNNDAARFVKIVQENPNFWWFGSHEIKYLNVRIDTRDGGFILLDDKKEKRISPDAILDAIRKYRERIIPDTAAQPDEAKGSNTQ